MVQPPESSQERELRELIEISRRRLHLLRVRVALEGINARPENQIEIEDIERRVFELENQMRQLAEGGRAPEDAAAKSRYKIDRPLTNLESAFQYQTLNLRFSPRTQQHPDSKPVYEVLLQSDIGDVVGEFSAPFSSDDLLRFRLDVTGSINTGAGIQPFRGIRPIFERLKGFGHRLYDSLPSVVKERFQAARDSVPGARLRLTFRDAWLASIPWEFLYDPNHGEFLGLSLRSVVVRYAEVGYPPLVGFAPPLRILVATPAPRDLPPLQVDQERKRIQDALADLKEAGLVEIQWLDFQESKRPVSLESLHDGLFNFRPHVLHFIGHGGLDEQQEGVLFFEQRETWRAEAIKGVRLAQLITSSDNLRLVFLNACQGATGSDVEKLGGVAAALANKGVAATLAMQFPVTDQAAIEFSGKFYQRVAEGAPIDVAVQEGRRHLGVVKDNPVEWAAPVLYLTPRDGRVFRQVQGAEA